MFESLESRQLFNDTTLSLHKGVLKIVGTGHRDRIILSGPSGALAVKIDGHTQIVKSRVRSVYVYAGRGNDTVDGSQTAFTYYIEGGAGNDTIATGTANDTVFGGVGDDELKNLGDTGSLDYLDGGAGDDYLLSSGTMNGGAGDDLGEVDGPYFIYVFASGLEKFNTYDGYDGIPFEGSVSELKTDLTTHNGHLVLKYQLYDREQSISEPFLRTDGRIGLDVHMKRVNDGSTEVATFTFNARYTKRALSRGLIISYDDETPDRPVLLPMG